MKPGIMQAVLLLAAVLTTAASAGAQQAGLQDTLPIDPQVRIGELPNGIRYYIRQNPKPEERAELRLVVDAGSVLEEEEQRGLAHFVEHMAFNGTRNFAKQELVNYLQSIGMRFGPDLNAYTSFDETVYMLTVPTDTAGLLETGIRILDEWAEGQVFDPEQIDLERGVVVEEWRLGRGAGMRMLDEQLPVLLQGSRYAERLPIGRREVLESFPHGAAERFYRDWYRPDLMAVVAVGDFDPDEVQRMIRAHFEDNPAPTSPPPERQFPVPPHEETLFAIASDPEATNASVSIYYKLPVRDRNSTAAFRQGLIENLYHRMLNSRLVELTQQADPPFLGASSGQGRWVRSAVMAYLGAGVPDTGIVRGLEALASEAERVDRHGFTVSELEREKADLLRGLERAYAERDKTNSGAFASEYVAHYLEGEPIPGIAHEYELARELAPGIQLEEVNRLAQEWIADRNRVVLVSAPEKEGLRIPSEAELREVFRAVRSREVAPYEDVVSDSPLVANPPEPGRVVTVDSIPELGVTTWELGNGARVVLKPTDFKDDEILLRAFSLGGSSLVPDEDYRSATLATSIVGVSGLGSFSMTELEKALAGKAVGVNPFIGSLEEGLAGSASPRDFETLLELVYLHFTAPRTDSTAFASLITRIGASLENRGASPQTAFQDTIQVTMTRHHFRARPLTPEVLADVDLQKALSIYRDRFADAGEFTFLLVGNFEPDTIRPLVERYIGGLPATGREERWRDVGIERPEGIVEKTVRRGLEPKSQAYIAFTGPFEYTRENRYAIGSLAEALEIRLRDKLREALGGTYSVNVSASPSREPRPEYTFSVSFGAAPERLPALLREVHAELELVRTEGPSTEDVQKVREMQRRSREVAMEQNGFWIGQLHFAERMGLDPREILRFDELTASLTPELLRDAARRYLRPDNYVQVSLYPEDRT